MSDQHVLNLDEALRPTVLPGVREDASGNRYYSANWLGDYSVPSGKLAAVVAIAGESPDERAALRARRSAQDVIARQRATVPPDGNIGTTGALSRARPIGHDGRTLDEVDVTLEEADRLRVLVAQALASASRHARRLVEHLSENVDTTTASIVNGRRRTIDVLADAFGEDVYR